MSKPIISTTASAVNTPAIASSYDPYVVNILQWVGKTAMSKSFTQMPDGTITEVGYPKAKQFIAKAKTCKNLSDLHEELVDLQTAKRANEFIILGAPKLLGELITRRTKDKLNNNGSLSDPKEVDSREVVFFNVDTDDYDYGSPFDPNSFSADELYGLAQSILRTHGLPEFTGAQCVFQWSSSASKSAAKGIVRCHIWLQLDNPVPLAKLRQWVRVRSSGLALGPRTKKGADASVLTPNQPNYTARPTFWSMDADGVSHALPDPIQTRTFLLPYGTPTVPSTTISSIELPTPLPTTTDVPSSVADGLFSLLYDALANEGRILASPEPGVYHIRCTREHEHSSESGESTSTVFAPTHGGLGFPGYSCLRDCHRDVMTVWDLVSDLGIKDAWVQLLQVAETAAAFDTFELADEPQAKADTTPPSYTTATVLDTVLAKLPPRNCSDDVNIAYLTAVAKLHVAGTLTDFSLDKVLDALVAQKTMKLKTLQTTYNRLRRAAEQELRDKAIAEGFLDPRLAAHGFIAPPKWHDIVESSRGAVTIADTLLNTKAVMDAMGTVVRFNQMSREESFKGGILDSMDIGNAVVHFRSACEAVGFHSKAYVDHLQSIAIQHAYHPVRDKLAGIQWDGVDRLPCVTDCLVGETPVALKRLLFERWAIGAVQAVIAEVPSSQQGVLVLQGNQGLGKTRWLESMTPGVKGAHLGGEQLDPHSVDSVRKVTAAWICELGELDGTFKRDMPALQAFITRADDTYRIPYATTGRKYARRAAFTATVNNPEYLTNTHGNRRWFTISVTQMLPLDGIDMWQFWAQMAQMYKNGAKFWLEKDELDLLNEHNDRHMQEDSIYDAAARHYGRPHPESDSWKPRDYLAAGYSHLPASTACTLMLGTPSSSVKLASSQDARAMGAALQRLGYEKRSYRPVGGTAPVYGYWLKRIEQDLFADLSPLEDELPPAFDLSIE